MPQINVAKALDRLVPLPQYGGANLDTEESYNLLRWNDPRPKPSWADVVAAWDEIKAEQDSKAEAEQLALTVIEDRTPELLFSVIGWISDCQQAGRLVQPSGLLQKAIDKYRTMTDSG